MNYKKSAAILSLVAVPVAVTAIGDAPVQAAESSKDQVMINHSWVNPYHIYDSTLKKPTYIRVASLGNIAANTIVNATTVEELKEAIYENIRQYNTSFSIAYKGNTDTLSQNLENILEGIHTDLSMTYEAGTLSRYSYSASGYVNDVTIAFTVNYHTTAEQEAFVNSEVERIAGELFTSAMSDLAKVKAVNDYIVLNTTYSTNTIASPHAAYAILKEGKGVCQAYALLAYRLLKKAGIDAYYVTGDVEDVGHAWNLVKVNGKWYHLDTTWNDPTFNASAGDMSDFVRYKYFLVPDSIIELDHKIDDKNYPVAIDNTFAPLHTVETSVQVGSTLYFPSRDYNIQLYKLDLNNIAAGSMRVSATRVQYLVHVDEWLYFSNYSNGGYLSKMKLDGTEQSVVDYKSITSLKRDGNNLVYTDTNNATYTLQIIDPEAENQAAANAVVALINRIDETATNFMESVANARVAYDALTSTQKGMVTNYNKLETAEGNIQANEATVLAVITQIAQLNEFASDFNVKVNETKIAYDGLDSVLKAEVSNYSVLETAIAKAADNVVKATDVEELINAININEATYYGATTGAREALNALTAAQRTLVSATAISKLEAAEQQKTADEEAVFSVNYQLDLLNHTAANFKDIVPTIRAGYNALTANQKTLVLKLTDLEAAEAKYQEYQTTASQLAAEIAALNNASPTFQQEVQTVNSKYNALNLAQQGFVSDEMKVRLNELVALSIANANSADMVMAKIHALAITNTSFMADVQAARIAYNALTPTQQGFVTNFASLESAEVIATKIKDVVNKIASIPETTVVGLVDNFDIAKTAYDALSSAEQKHVTNSNKLNSTEILITAANTVTTTIAGLTATSSIAEIEAARAAYNALTANQKQLVTNSAHLISIETALTSASSGVGSKGSTGSKGGGGSKGSTPSTAKTQVNPTSNVPTQPEIKVEQHGNTYTAVVSIPTEVDKAKPITITISENISVKVPQTAIPTIENGASMAISFDVSEDNKIQFKASLNDEPVKFATYVEFEIANLAEDAVILRVDENGEIVATPFIIRDGKHVVKTMTPGDFVVSTEMVTFSDVQKDGHKAYIEALAKHHIIKGVNEESFNPNAGISRAQFAVMIARAMNLEAEEETKFNDVKGQWYESAVQALAEVEIIKGKNPETFDPDQTLTRQQAALMVTRLLEFAGVELPAVDSEKLPFNDLGGVSESAKQQVAMVYALGIFTGKEDGSFDPTGELTRSQMAKVLYKTLQLAEML